MTGFKSGASCLIFILLWVVIALFSTRAGVASSLLSIQPSQVPSFRQEADENLPAPIIQPSGNISETLYLPMMQTWSDPGPAWLTYFNLFRSQANLPSLLENIDWSDGGVLHSRYMVKNDLITHYEDPSNPWYTAGGYEAGRKGNIFVSSSSTTSDETAIDFWMVAPFHAISMLDPQLYTTGLGSYQESDGGWQTGVTLDVLRGLGPLPNGISFPLPFPSDGSETWLHRFNGNEWPDPLTSCPGYSPPTGAPIMLQLGVGNVTPSVSDFSLKAGDSTLPACIFDETTYVNTNGSTQSTGRSILNNRDAIIIIPRDPLVSGQEYNVSISANGSITQWSFTAVDSPMAASSADSIQFMVQ